LLFFPPSLAARSIVSATTFGWVMKTAWLAGTLVICALMATLLAAVQLLLTRFADSALSRVHARQRNLVCRTAVLDHADHLIVGLGAVLGMPLGDLDLADQHVAL